MSKRCFIPKRFRAKTRKLIEKADEILTSFAAMGVTATVRMMYYQFVSLGLIPNGQKAYDRVQDMLVNARLAGLIDWDHLEDRTRNLMQIPSFDDAEDALQSLIRRYHLNLWTNQKYRPEIWIEKDALVGVIERVCNENDVPYFSCRGYTSISEMYNAAMRLERHIAEGYTPYIIHFGDHDPSGIDMSRDITNRIRDTFMSDCEFKRVALNMDQIKKLNTPPFPAKVQDCRYAAYVAEFGEDSWELDALHPTKFRELIEGELDTLRDDKIWNEDIERRDKDRARLVHLAEHWGDPNPATALEVHAKILEWKISKKEIDALKKLLNKKPPRKGKKQ